MYDILVVGGGVAGLFCIARLAECLPRGLKILLIEKTGSLGKKLLLSGSGQCNFTHWGDMKDFATHYGDHFRFVKQALYHLTNEDIVTYFSERGVESFIRADGKVFPANFRATEIRDLLANIAQKYSVEIALNMSLTKINPTSGDKACLVSTKTYDGQTKTLNTKYLILTTGGASYPETGSTGDIMTLMSDLGVEVVPLRPALSVPTLRYMSDKNGFYSHLAGITLEKATISIYRQNKLIKTSSGDILFSHTGLTGPDILDNSRYFEPKDTIRLYLTEYVFVNDLENAVISLINKFPKRLFRNIVYQLNIPRNLIDFLTNEVADILDKKTSEVSKNERKLIVKLLHSMDFEIELLGDIKTAMCSSGGVSLNEINKQNMSLKKYPNIFVAGECVDVDGDTGGYNIHFAFASANLIVRHLTEKGFDK